MNNNQDLYEILGLHKSDNPSQDDIKKAFRKASIKWHPDRWSGKSKEEQDEASRQFQLINQANQILSDEKKRRIYDQTGNVEQADKGQEGFDPFSMFTGGGAGGFSFDFGDIGEMFGFGSRRNSQQQARVVPGQDLQVRIKIKDIAELWNPTEHTIRYKKQTRCPVCHGGANLKSHTCEKCHGTGVYVEREQTMFGYKTVQRPCPYCNATGKIQDEKCKNPKCNHGFVQETVEKTFMFPKGVQHTQAIVFNGEGSESKSPQGPNGRLIVIAEYDFDLERYRIEGADVTEKFVVPYEDAILGSKLLFHHPSGQDMNITIAPLTPAGKRLMLKGRGLQIQDQWGNSIQGNYILEITYGLPSKLSDEEKEALEKIKEMHIK